MDVKDVVDILFIADRYEFHWDEIFEDAKEKDLWVDPIEISKLIKTFPVQLFDSVKWILKVDLEKLADSVRVLHDDIFLVKENSLVRKD